MCCATWRKTEKRQISWGTTAVGVGFSGLVSFAKKNRKQKNINQKLVTNKHFFPRSQQCSYLVVQHFVKGQVPPQWFPAAMCAMDLSFELAQHGSKALDASHRSPDKVGWGLPPFFAIPPIKIPWSLRGHWLFAGLGEHSESHALWRAWRQLDGHSGVQCFPTWRAIAKPNLQICFVRISSSCITYCVLDLWYIHHEISEAIECFPKVDLHQSIS